MPDLKDSSNGNAIEPEHIPTLTDVDEIADEIISEMPEPSQHAIDAAAEEQAAVVEMKQKHADKIDSKGRGFDPELHVVDTDGTPLLTATGKLRCKRGRKKGQSSVKPPGASSQPMQDTGLSEMTVQAAVTGKTAANMLMTVGVALGGEEWQPRVDKSTGLDEQTMLEKSFSDYFLATGRTDIPPGWALLFAIGAYSLPRFRMPKTQKRTLGAFGKLKAWLYRRKLEKENGPQSDSRND